MPERFVRKMMEAMQKNLETLLKSLRSEILLPLIDQLPKEKRLEVIRNLESIDQNVFEEQQKLLVSEKEKGRFPFLPFKDAVYWENNLHYQPLGEQLLREGKVAALLMAGGQGTRLGFDGPKGCFPISPVKQKTLFQIFAEKVKAASEKAARPLKLVIMTSLENYEETLRHFEENRLFGLERGQILFFSQGNLPLLDQKGQLFFQTIGELAFGADGNGSSIKELFRSGIGNQLMESGVEHLTFNLIDNPLADPFDEVLIGLSSSRGDDVTIKAVSRISEEEKVGAIVLENDHPLVVEYSEFEPEKYREKTATGELLFSLANISLFCFSLFFLSRMAKAPFPLHKALKSSSYVDALGAFHEKGAPSFWKFERFIFDLLPYSKKTSVLVQERSACFSPLKNKTGPDSRETVQKALILQAQRTLENLTGLKPPPTCLEIDPAFYYPTNELKNLWKGKQVPDAPFVSSSG